MQRERIQDEFDRLKTSIINKDSHIKQLEDLLELERQRRNTETKELRNLFYQEQEKSIQAAREAEKCLTEIKLYQKQADKAENEADRLKQEIDKIKQHNLKVESQRYDGVNLMNDRFES